MPEHWIPPLVVSLGQVLDLELATGDGRVFVDDWSGWHLLTNPSAFDNAPGRARLFLVPGELEDLDADELAELEGAEAYERWHERDAERLGELEIPDGPARYRQGRLIRMGYRSDKWNRRGEPVDYTHDFDAHGAHPPWLYTDAAELEASRFAVVVGGSMTVTERGIDG